MKKSEATIKQKWDKKTEEMRVKAKFRFDILIQNRKKVMEKNFDYEVEKYNRKRDAYIRKKEEEYKRKCLNEIREWKGKPKREYKSE